MAVSRRAIGTAIWITAVCAITVATRLHGGLSPAPRGARLERAAPLFCAGVRAPGPETGIVCAPSRGAFLGAAIAAGFAPGSCAAIALPAAAAAGDLFAVEARNEGCAIARAGRLPAAAALLCGARLDLNAATEADLALLPGIGPARARRIAESRRTEGPFPDVGSLDRVPGIGPKTVEQLRPWILIGAPL